MGKPTMEQLREQTLGQVITAGETGYEEACRVYNGMIDRHPRVIVQCMDAGDVMATVAFARDNGLDLSVRGGSHGVPGFGTNDDGVVIDLSPMNTTRVDPDRRASVAAERAWSSRSLGDDASSPRIATPAKGVR